MAQNEIYGNLKGIRNSVIDELKTFYDIRLESGQLLTAELAARMADVTDFINREVSVYISRSGQILAGLYSNPTAFSFCTMSFFSTFISSQRASSEG